MTGMFGIINNEVLIVVLIVIKVTRYATQARDLQMVDHAIRIPAIVEGGDLNFELAVEIELR